MPLRPRNGLPMGNGIASTQWASNHVENGIASTQWASNRVGNGIVSTQWASNHVGNGIASTQWASNHVRSVFAIRNGISHVFQAVISLGEHTLQHEKAPIPPKNGPRKRSNPQVAVGRSHRRGLRRIVNIHFVAYKLLQASLRFDPQLCTGNLSEALFIKKPQVRGPRAIFTNKT